MRSFVGIFEAPMPRLAFLLAAFLLLSPLSARAADPVIAQQVGMLPPSPGPHPDLEALLSTFWPAYYNVSGPLGFTIDQVRVGRADLHDDGNEALLLMIDHPGWQADLGKPFMIATWSKPQWTAIGWGWGDEDSIFMLTETKKGWHSVETGTQTLSWIGKQYERINH